MKKKIFVFSICVVMLGIIAFTVYAFEEKSNLSLLTETEKQQKLRELEEIVMPGYREFPYQEKVLRGEIEDDLERMTLEEVKKIISENDTFKEIMAEFKARQPYPDFKGGSGLTWMEYWFDDAGNERIYLYTNGQIFYEKRQGEKIINWINLYR